LVPAGSAALIPQNDDSTLSIADWKSGRRVTTSSMLIRIGIYIVSKIDSARLTSVLGSTPRKRLKLCNATRRLCSAAES
jgi:hypothetical protein